ncbi:MAG TPA: OsmC family protein [Polyangia bacterium]|jgi:putative redox protein|nr:OsmC family protein [Polyangia bacterium]
MTAPSDGAPETLVAAAHLESGTVPYGQTIRIGHHVVPCDEPASRGGADTGPSPTGLLLAALAGCTSITLRMYADRKGWDLGQINVSLKLLRSPAADHVERTIHVGAALAPEQLARLLEIADKTPVTKMLKHGMEIATKIA